MKKRKFAISALIMSMLLSVTLLTLPVSADESATDTLPHEELDTGMHVDDGGVFEAGAKEIDGGASAEKNAFSIAFGFFEENAGEIFSVLSFLASLLMMATYKSGLLPLVEKGIGALAGGVKRIGEKAENIENETGAFNSEFKAKLEDTRSLLEKIEAAVGALDERLSAACADKESRARLETVLRGEIDMLYEIFMAASLPQYLKERVGERIGEMKHALGEGAPENEAQN